MLNDVNVVLQKDSEECIQNTDSTVGPFVQFAHLFVSYHGILKIHALMCYVFCVLNSHILVQI